MPHFVGNLQQADTELRWSQLRKVGFANCSDQSFWVAWDDSDGRKGAACESRHTQKCRDQTLHATVSSAMNGGHFSSHRQ
jgi:hypothetical protein